MQKSLVAHLRGNAIAYAALFVALSGTAWAAAQIGAGDIKDNAIRSQHIKEGQVKTADVLDESLSGSDVQDGSLSGSDVQEETFEKVAFGRFEQGFYADATEDQLAELTNAALLVHDDGDVDTTKEVIVEHTGLGGVFHVLTSDSPTVTPVTAGNSVAVATTNNVLDFVIQAGHAAGGGLAISIHCGFDPDFNGATQPHVSCFSLKSNGNG